MNPINLSINTIIERNPDQIFSNIDGELFMLSIDNSEYYNLSSSAVYIWEYLSEPRYISDIVILLQNEFDISFEECLADILPFLLELITKGIIRIKKE